MKRFTTLTTAWAVTLLTGCSDPGAATDVADAATEAPPPGQTRLSRTYTEERESCVNHDPNRMPLFGDVHVHTSFSFDAAANTTGATPVDANRFARGEPIPFWPLDENGKPSGTIRLDRPLDFLAVTDHGEFLGERALCRSPGSPRYDSPFCERYRSDERTGMSMLAESVRRIPPFRLPQLCGEDGDLCREWARDPWQSIIDAAEAAYDRSEACSFTSFVAYEHTGVPAGSNVHHNVIFRTGAVPDRPISFIETPTDSELWAAMDIACREEDGCDYVTIPHNSNLANGRMAPYAGIEPTAGNRRAYALTRQHREPAIEVFQHKGGSECINGLAAILGPPDELCDVEQVRAFDAEVTYGAAQVQEDGTIARQPVTQVTTECEAGEVGTGGMVGAGCVDRTDFVRSALLVGLEEAAELGVNPVKLGMIGSTDTHAATPGAAIENDWRGHVSGESSPAERLQAGLLTSNIVGNPGGLAGVWAVENSRDAIFEAMRRREVFATSGPRIVPRLFAGWEFPADLCSAADLVDQGYARGVAMGSNLPAAPADDSVPTFVAWAARDPVSGGLERLQIVKGWIDADGRHHAEVRDIAGDAASDAGVDLATGARTGNAGSDSLCAVHRDDTFDPAQPAYWYLRVVETPSARWSHLDCLRLTEDDRPAVCTDGSVPQVIREMAWTSPIFYER